MLKQPVLNPLVDSIRNSILNSLSSQTRNFIHLSGVNQSKRFAPFTLGSVFKISLLVYPTVDRCHILSNSKASGRLFLETSNNKLEVTLDDGNPVSFAGVLPLRALSELILERDSNNTWSMKVNGVDLPVTLGQGLSSSLTLDSFGGIRGSATGVPIFRGTLANVKITGTGITSGGEPVNELFYPLDDSPDDFPVIRETINGKNGMFINGSVDAYSEFTEQENGDWQTDGWPNLLVNSIANTVDWRAIGGSVISDSSGGMRTVSSGSSWDRAWVGSRVSISGDAIYSASFIVRPGTSRMCRVVLQGASNPTAVSYNFDTQLANVTSMGSGVVTDAALAELENERYLLTVAFSPSSDQEIVIGVGPHSDVAGEYVTVVSAQFQNGLPTFPLKNTTGTPGKILRRPS